jgi:hypothetical protein
VQSLSLSKAVHGNASDPVFEYQFDKHARNLTWVSDKVFGGNIVEAQAAFQFAVVSGVENLTEMAQAFAEFGGAAPTDLEAQVALQTSRICGAIKTSTQKYDEGDACTRAQKTLMRYIHANGADRATLQEPMLASATELESQYDTFLAGNSPANQVMREKYLTAFQRLKTDGNVRKAYVEYWREKMSAVFAEQNVERRADFEPEEDPTGGFVGDYILGEVLKKMAHRYGTPGEIADFEFGGI